MLKDILDGYTDVDDAMSYLTAVVPGPKKPVPVETVKAWALKHVGLIFKLKQAAKGTDEAAALADSILEAIGINMPAWDMENPSNLAMMDAAIAQNWISTDQKNDLVSLADTFQWRWQSLGLKKYPMRWEVEEALNG